MKPILSQSSQVMLTSANGPRRANARLQDGYEAASAVELPGLSVSWRMIHLATGLYEAGEGFGLHVHGSLQVEMVLSGQFAFQDPSGRSILSPGEALFVLPYHKHSWQCLHPGFMMGGLIDVAGPARQELLCTARRRGCVMQKVTPPTGAARLRELLRLLTHPSHGVWQQSVLPSLLKILLAEVLESFAELVSWDPGKLPAQPSSDSRARHLRHRAMEFLEANYAYPVQVRDVAMQTGVSSRQLARIFQQTGGDSVNQALIRIRLQKACELLENRPDLSIKEIAYVTGFSSPAYFTASFRKAYGTRPSDPRR